MHLFILWHSHTGIAQIFPVHKVCPEGIQPRNIKKKIEILIEEDTGTRNTVQKTMMPQSPSKRASWDLTQFSQSASAAPLYCPDCHRWSEISSLSKVILVLGKARSCFSQRRCQIWAVEGLSHLGDLLFCQKALHQMWCVSRHVVVMKLPITSLTGDHQRL